MNTNNAPTYEELETLEECYNKCRFMLNDKRLKKSDKFFYQHYDNKLEFLEELKKDLQKVIKSLNFKHMNNEIKNYKK